MEKKKYLVRLVAGAAALCVSAAFVAPSPAGAESSPGVGTTKASHTLLSVQLGTLLDIAALADTAQSTIDNAVEPSSAFSRLEALRLRSSVLPAIDALSFPVHESRTPGGQPSVSTSAADLGSPSLVPGLPLPLTNGLLAPATLTSALDAAGAKSALDAALTNLSLLSILNVRGVDNRMSTAASLPSADGTRALAINKIELLNLGDLLGGLLLDLAKLPLSVIDQLVELLNLPVALLAGENTLTDVTDALVATITGILGTPGLVPSDVVNTVKPVNDLLTSVGATVGSLVSTTGLVPTASLATATVQELLVTLQNTLLGLLKQVLGLLNDLPLLSLGGANINVATKAAGTLADSAATVDAVLEPVKVLGLTLGGVNLANVGSLVTGISSQLGTVLGAIHPSLAKLVSVGVLEKTTSVTSADGYINALAGFNLLRVDVVPPLDLLNIVSGLTGNTGLSSLGKLSAAGVANPAGSLPVLGGNALGLGNLLNLPATVGALSKGLSVKVGAIQSASRFRLASAPSAAVAAPAPAPGDTLPRTGGDTGTLGILAAGMAALALGVRRWARRPETD